MTNVLKETIKDMAYYLLVTDRKEDEELPRGEIERMIDDGEVTIREISEYFEECLRRDVEP